LYFQLYPSKLPTEGIESGSSGKKSQNDTWPTPRVSDTEGGVVKNVEKKNDSYSRVNKKGVRFGVKLKDAVGYEEEKLWPTPIASSSQSASIDASKKEAERLHPKGQNHLAAEMASRTWPTPSANEDAAGTPNGKMQRMLGNHPGIRGTTQKEFDKGALNPDWVEWLMGYAPGYTDPEYTEPLQLEDHLGFESEPDIPRVTTRKEHRVNRLKCLGNSIVPQIMYEIGNAILADYNKEK
jgi:hypothetical protein